MVDRRSLQSWTYAAVAVAGSVPILFLPNLMYRPTPPAGDAGYTAVKVACMAVGLAWAAWFAIAAFRRAEEFVQERSKFAWYWGSLMGLVIAVPVFGLIAMGGAPWIASGHDATRAFKIGLALPLAAQMMGAVVMSAWWRATRR
jgi:hypothetical protein